ncbi:MAG: Uncharacterised protein [Owenweeksia sp. TMED14]|nr:MAG: Uncharacterised protein [Owenweeksia sp. TMED14]|tara:strand:- start:1239 stop:1772 length:534 start_codon:yes stop_codon:yes gene_type:complete
MKKIILGLSIVGLASVACNQNASSDHEGHALMIQGEKFNKNCETVRAHIDEFQAENVDYSNYADDFYMISTAFDARKDTISLDELMDSDQNFWRTYDAELVTELVLLPGVLAETGEPNGSVRYYGQWRITKAATDTSEAKEALLKLYESFDFDEEGKISVQMHYGDMGLAFQHLEGK